jgi:hypothetical protein
MVETKKKLCETHIVGNESHELIIGPEKCRSFSQDQILLAGFSDVAPPFLMVRLRPPQMHILVCTGGEGVVLVEGRFERCGAGQAYICPPGDVMAYKALQQV